MVPWTLPGMIPEHRIKNMPRAPAPLPGTEPKEGRMGGREERGREEGGQKREKKEGREGGGKNREKVGKENWF